MRESIWQLLYFLAFYGISDAQKTLKLVHVMYRHGDRSPTHTYPTDPYKDYPWQQGSGQLTQEGMRQQLRLGQWLRQRYIDTGFMNSTYINNELYVRSTDKDRAIHSALSNLAGLYPPEGFQQFDPDIKWQPIAVHTWPEDYDRILWMDKECDKYTAMYIKGLQSDQYRQLYEDHKEMLEYTSEKAGYPNVDFNQIWDLYDTLFCQNFHNISLPSWVTEDLFNQLWEFAAVEFIFDSFNSEMIVLRAGPFITQLSDNLQRKVENNLEPRDRKMFMYSAHDSTLASVMIAMDVWNQVIPPYCATLLWELYDSPEGTVVNVLLKNSTREEPYPLVIPGCQFDCPTDKFLSLLAPVKFEGDWLAECAYNSGNLSRDSYIAIAVMSGVLLIILAGIVAWCVKRNKKSSQYLPIVNYEK